MSDSIDNETWNQYEIFFPNDEIRKKVLRQIISKLKNDDFYFNQYSGKDICFIKLGIKRKIEDIKLDFEEELQVKIVPATPDLRPQGIENPTIIDDLKFISTKIAVKQLNLEKLEIPQIYLIIHFLMNQLGYSYAEEIYIYSSLIKSISKDWINKDDVTTEM